MTSWKLRYSFCVTLLEAVSTSLRSARGSALGHSRWLLLVFLLLPVMAFGQVGCGDDEVGPGGTGGVNGGGIPGLGGLPGFGGFADLPGSGGNGGHSTTSSSCEVNCECISCSLPLAGTGCGGDFNSCVTTCEANLLASFGVENDECGDFAQVLLDCLEASSCDPNEAPCQDPLSFWLTCLSQFTGAGGNGGTGGAGGTVFNGCGDHANQCAKPEVWCFDTQCSFDPEVIGLECDLICRKIPAMCADCDGGPDPLVADYCQDPDYVGDLEQCKSACFDWVNRACDNAFLGCVLMNNSCANTVACMECAP